MAYTRSAYRMAGFSAVSVYSNGGANPIAVNCSASFRRRYTNESDANDFEESARDMAVSFDLLAAPSTQVTVSTGGGVTVTHAQLAALIRKATEQAGGL